MKTIDTLKKAFPKFDWIETDGSFHGAISVTPIKKRIADKSRVTYKNVYIFISSRLYGTTERSFRYAIAYQKTELIPYKHKTPIELEGNKVFQSDKLLKNLVSKLIENVDVSKYTLK